MPEVRALNENPGIKTHGNPVTLPSGSAIECKNFKCTRDNVYSKVRGRKTYGSGLPSENITQMLQYKDRLICHMGNNTLYYDSNGSGTFSQYTGTFTDPESGYKMQSLETSGNLYITDSAGIKRVDSLSGTFVNAGIPKGLSFDIRIIDSTNWMSNGNTVSYRIVWTYTDTNNNKHIGAPSERQDITNSAGADRAVELRIYIPDEITVNYYIEIYRSSQTTGTPPEDYQLVYQAYPTSTEITAGVLTLEDILPDDWRGASLYTNTTQEGISQSTERPPKANPITRYKNFTFYGNIKNLHRLYTALISTANITAGTSTIKIDDGTNDITFNVYAENAGNAITGCADNGSGLIRVTSVAHGFSNGDYVRIYDVEGTTEANGVWVIEGVTANTFDLTGSSFSNAYTANGTADRYEDYGATPRFILYSSGTDAQNIENTAKSIVRCINLTTTNTYWNAYYNSTSLDPVGKIELTAKTMGADPFYIIVDSTDTGGNFTPTIPTSGTTYISTNDNFQHAIMWSKEDQPEAVPLVNIKKIGSQDDPIVKVIGLRDSLIIINQKDGIWRMTGETVSTFDFHEFDGTVECKQLNSIAKGENSIYMFSNAGYVKISDVGAEVIGRDTEKDDLKPIQVSGFDTEGYGWYYQSEKSYKISTYKDENSTDNDIVKEYNVFANAWTHREVGVYTNDTKVSVGIVVNDIEYTAPLTGNNLLVERKDVALSDYTTPDISNTITAINSTDKYITLGTAITIHDDALLKQGSLTRTVTAANSTTQLTLLSVSNLAIDMGSINVAGCADNGSGVIRVTTSTIHGLDTGNGITIAGVVGTTEANGDWTITVVDTTHFDLDGSTYANAYVSGGTVTNEITIYPGIKSQIKFQQLHGGLPEYDKFFEKVTIFFDNDETSVSNVEVITTTDADTNSQVTNLNGTSTDVWEGEWSGVWGDRVETDRMLMLIPEEHARGSMLYLTVIHAIPKEKCDLCGYSVIFSITDTRCQVYWL